MADYSFINNAAEEIKAVDNGAAGVGPLDRV